ncbi:hypothetical protein [Mesorhizobium sp. M2E.F.Ca.ET.154.01.1.1]|uniref:hypothetical protein n=1 Tax=Mesorhizobium sp. M2E.F.Ca.ET.154.01.1.1 TaxID=2500521 RepID=UPI0010931E51|nr:hypothetical protein [Mesorhizobium sp. M2E.F.Ca.ET.154.01.1.1]
MACWKMLGVPGARYNYLDWVDRHGERSGRHTSTDFALTFIQDELCIATGDIIRADSAGDADVPQHAGSDSVADATPRFIPAGHWRGRINPALERPSVAPGRPSRHFAAAPCCRRQTPDRQRRIVSAGMDIGQWRHRPQQW